MQITITNGTITQVQETLSPAAGYCVPTTITVVGATYTYNDYSTNNVGVISMSELTSTVTITATAMSQSERFYADMGDITNIINTKAGVSGAKYLPQIKHAAASISTDKPEETKTVALSMVSGDQVINPTSGSVMTQVTVEKPNTFVNSNIKDGITIGGITGTYTHVTTDAAASGNILAGKIAYVNGNQIIGTMAIYDGTVTTS